MHVALFLAIIGCFPEGGSAAGLKQIDFKSRMGSFEGCFVLREIGQGWTLRYNEAGCTRRLSPCSTFKIFNSLAGLDSGVLKDAATLFKWDGTPQSRKECEHDHTLATAVRDSVVWYFQEVAWRVGAERMKKYLAACDYGNQDTSAGIDKFWLDASLRISADEQVRFLEGLYTDKLPFDRRAMGIVREILVQRSGASWVFSGKTGTAGNNNVGTLGWFVGHLKSGDRQFVFAMNIAKGDEPTGRKAREIVLEILKDLGLVD